jgi:hypothetical protein
VSSVEQNTENMKTGIISGREYQKHENWCHRCSTDGSSFHVLGTLFHRWHQFSWFCYSAPLMTLVFLFQSIENMKTGAIGGAEYLKHKNWCHQWSRVPKTENWCHRWSRVPKT